MYTIDACVWVNSFDPHQIGHSDSRRLILALGQQRIPIRVPTLVLAEVAGAISRKYADPTRANDFAMRLASLEGIQLSDVDLDLAKQAKSIAAQAKLRGADAIYVAVALQSNCTLITLDTEQLTRSAGIVSTQTPTLALSALNSPSSPSGSS